MTVGITELPPEGMQLGGVALAGDAERGTKTTEGLSLLFTTAGITVQGPQPQIERLLVWSGLDSASCREKVVLPDGRNAAVMELTSGGQSIRFLFPTESVTPGQAAYLDQALPHWLARYKGAPSAPAPAAAGAGNGSTPPPPPPPPVTTDPPSHLAAPAVAAAAGAVAGAAAAGGAPTAAAPPAPHSPPPPPPPSAYEAAPSFSPPPPGTTPPLPGPPAAGAGWPASPDPVTDGSAWSGPPAGDAVMAPPPQKSSRWRKDKTPEAAAAPVSYQAHADPSQAPFAPPNDPVRLDQTTLPPPPPDAPGYPTAAGPAVWRPPVDPVTGDALWEGQPGSTVMGPPELATPVKGRAKRKADKADKAAAAASAAAIASAAAVGAPGADAATLGAPPAPGADSGYGAPAAMPPTTPFDPTFTTPPPGEPGGAYGSAAPEEQPRRRNSRLLPLLLVALVVVVAAIGYFVYKRHQNANTTATTVAVVPATTAATALATSVNLRQTDLPSGWAPSTAAGQPVRPPVAPVAAQAQASRTLAQCLGSTPSTVSGLFAGTVLPGQSGTATSPSFQSPTDPTVAMHSVTRVMTSAAEAEALAVPFSNGSFVACYTAYQSSVVSAAVPGATAAVQSVPLTAPSGVQSFGYLTTLTIPNQGTEVIGQAFIVGGRIESTLEPTTGGAPVPTDAFTPAYNAIAGRVALDVGK